MSDKDKKTEPADTPQTTQPEIPQFPNDRTETNRTPIIPSDRIEKGNLGDILTTIIKDIS